jgi:hypothetical protein
LKNLKLALKYLRKIIVTIGQNDRIVIVTGTLDEQMRAIDLIVSKLAEDPQYSQSMSSPFTYSGQCHLFVPDIFNIIGLKILNQLISEMNQVRHYV